MPSPRQSDFNIQQRTPMLAVDAVIYLNDNRLVLIARKNAPFKGWWALPGGIVEVGETVEQAIIREVREETGLEIELQNLVGVFSNPDRDPRGHIVSIAFLATRIGGDLAHGSDATRVQAFRKLPSQLAFDHKEIIAAAEAFRRGEDRKTR
ncbi:MAG: NUDIX domain-containing protein [Candidatus Hodarchaeota archaeon]